MRNSLIWLAVRIAAAIAIVVSTFGYAITGNHSDVLMGAGCGIAIGVGLGLRGGSRSGLWTGILIGSAVGMAVVLVAGGFSGNRWGFITPPVLALAVGLIDGLDRSSLSGYREMSRETLIVAVLLTLGFFPAHMAEGIVLGLRTSDDFLIVSVLLVFPLLLMPYMALMAGLLTHRREGWRDARPPRLLILGAAVPVALFVFLMATGALVEGRGLSGLELILGIAYALSLPMVAIPAAAFLLGRAAATWLQPRLRVYGRLAEYLRAMWVPIGGFAVGYLTIIVLFAGFYGTLERFSPGAFAGMDAGSGVTDWLSFAFFTALGQDFLTVAPVSVGARLLVGVHLIFSAGWAVVLFAAVMTSIGPKLDRIARRHAEEGGE
ncbi:MAG: hypothetical protein F4087_07540 [Gemmatimonadetes bacterium]|nr:hypothetical protein [Gemmatimonadota bacterium]MXX34784.1 hypothetical protein [Gemmatimonadota bacterium]MYA12677.1 hypothetical protein [Gemmatimonadota bacterium]MYD12468.1 hypothetical protein [Gemmatimonadota bacterium]MYE68822.1 hypothetical protein [Gemmatimonadota bacterium]